MSGTPTPTPTSPVVLGDVMSSIPVEDNDDDGEEGRMGDDAVGGANRTFFLTLRDDVFFDAKLDFFLQDGDDNDVDDSNCSSFVLWFGCGCGCGCGCDCCCCSGQELVVAEWNDDDEEAVVCIPLLLLLLLLLILLPSRSVDDIE